VELEEDCSYTHCHLVSTLLKICVALTVEMSPNMVTGRWLLDRPEMLTYLCDDKQTKMIFVAEGTFE
jgi:hypothetical protein